MYIFIYLRNSYYFRLLHFSAFPIMSQIAKELRLYDKSCQCDIRMRMI